MATKNPRLLVTLEPLLYHWVKKIAKLHGISMSLALRNMIKKEFTEEYWFWTKDWQSGEKEADENIKNKRYKDFDAVEKLLKDLKS